LRSLLSMVSREGQATDEEQAAIAVRSEYECNQTIARELYVAPVPRVYRIHVEAQAMQAASGVAAPASTRGMGGMAARPRHWATPDSTAETPYSKSAAGWRPNVGLVIRAAPPGAGARAAASTSSAEGAEAEASISVGATGWSCEFRAARSRSRSRTRPSAVPAAMAVARPSAGPTREARPPTPPICGFPVPAWIIARRSSDYIAGSDAPWIRAGIQVTDYHRGVPSASRARPHPHDAKARPHFGIPSTPRRILSRPVGRPSAP
jgi:hypothetical protein